MTLCKFSMKQARRIGRTVVADEVDHEIGIHALHADGVLALAGLVDLVVHKRKLDLAVRAALDNLHAQTTGRRLGPLLATGHEQVALTDHCGQAWARGGVAPGHGVGQADGVLLLLAARGALLGFDLPLGVCGGFAEDAPHLVRDLEVVGVY